MLWVRFAPKNLFARSFQNWRSFAGTWVCPAVVLAGGVAANSEIRKKIFDLKNEGYDVYAPIMKYCTDNASMVASAAFFFENTFDDIDVEVFSRV